MAIASFSGLSSGIQWRDMIDQIMQMESARRLKPVADRIKLQEKRSTAWGEYDNLVTKLRDAATSFSTGSAFGVYKTSATSSAVSGRALVSATAADTASPGTYDVEVLALAKAEKLGSAEVADAGAALGLAGTFHVNGRAVTLTAADSLAAVRDRINAANSGSNASGVTATILSTSAGSHRLILTADATGSRGIELVDSDTGVLADPKLGVLSGSLAANASSAEAGWVDSIRFSSRSEVLKDVLGISPPPAVSTILVGGVKVEVDFNSDTLDEVLAKIQAADPGAKMREEVVNGKTTYRLSTSASLAVDPDSAESERNLEALGFLSASPASRITAGTDARLRIDGYEMTRRTNTVSDAIAGVTLDLLASDLASRTSSVSTTDLSISADPKTIAEGSYAVALTDDGMGTITGATIGGEAAVWDAGTRTIRGADGSRFEGLSLAYTGGATSGAVGDLVIEGDISVEVKIERDAAATETKVKEFVDLYNQVVGFVKTQRDNKGALASDGSLRAMLGSVRDVLLSDVTGLSGTNPYTRLSLAGVEFTRDGRLELDSKTFTDALATSATDVAELFAGVGSTMKAAADAIVDDVDGSIKLHRETLSNSISSLKTRELDIEAALERQRVEMERQYTEMEVAMSRLQSQGSWLSSQLASLSPQ